MPPVPTDVLRAAFASLPASRYTADPDSLGDLRQKVCDAVDELKATGMMPEHVILAVKAIAMEAHVSGPLGNVLLENLVHWCLKQYFKE